MGAYENPSLKVIDTRFAAANKALAEGTKTTIAAIQNVQKQQAAMAKLKAENARRLNEKINKLGATYDKMTASAFNLIPDITDNLPAKQQAAMNDKILQVIKDSRSEVIKAGSSTSPSINANDVLKEEVLKVQGFVKQLNALSQISTSASNAEQALITDSKSDDALFLGNANYQTVLGAFGDEGVSDQWSNINFVKDPTNPNNHIIFVDADGDGVLKQPVTYTDQITGNTITKPGEQIISMDKMLNVYEAGKKDKTYYSTLGSTEKSYKLIQSQVEDNDVGINSSKYRLTGVEFSGVGNQQITTKIDQPNYVAIQNDLWADGGLFGGTESPEYRSSNSKVIDSSIKLYGDGDLINGVQKYVQKFYGANEKTGLGRYLNDIAKADGDQDEIDEINKFWYTAVKNELIAQNVLPKIEGFNTNSTSRVLRSPSYTVKDNKTRRKSIKSLAEQDANELNSFMPTTFTNQQEVTQFAADLQDMIGGKAYGFSTDERGSVSGVAAGKYRWNPQKNQNKGGWEALGGTSDKVSILLDAGSKTKARAIILDLTNTQTAKEDILRNFLGAHYTTGPDKDYIDYLVKHPDNSTGTIVFDDSGFRPATTTRTGASATTGSTGVTQQAGGGVNTVAAGTSYTVNLPKI